MVRCWKSLSSAVDFSLLDFSFCLPSFPLLFISSVSLLLLVYRVIFYSSHLFLCISLVFLFCSASAFRLSVSNDLAFFALFFQTSFSASPFSPSFALSSSSTSESVMHTPLLFRVPLSSSWKINISWRIWETGLDGVLKELDLQADEWLEQIPLFASLGCMICNQEMLGVDDFLSWIKRSSIRQGLWHTYCLVWMPCFESLKPPVPCPSFALRCICAHHIHYSLFC